MKRRVATLSKIMLAVSLCFAPALYADPIATYPSNIEGKLEYVPNQIIVRLKEADTPLSAVGAQGAVADASSVVAQLQKRFKLKQGKKLKQSVKNPHAFVKAPQSIAAFASQQASFLDNLYVFKTDSKNVPALARRLAQDPNVAYAEPDYIVHADSTPNDPYFSSQGSWGQSYMDLWGLHQMDTETAWDSVTGAGVVVAVVDSGVSFTNSELLNNKWSNTGEILFNGIDDDNNGFVDDYAGYDFVDNDVFPADLNGHGTHVAGTIAAAGNNSYGLVGVAYNAKIMAVRALNEQGSGSTSSLVRAMAYAVDNGAQVMNNSWGGMGSSKAFNDAVKYAYDNNVFPIFAAGNYNMDTMFATPANAPGAITVAASDVSNLKAGFSNWGHDVDIAAPGVDVLSVNVPGSYIAQNRPDSIVNFSFLRLNGTSMATPHVAGLAALLLEAKPDLTVDQFRSILRESATPWQGYSFLSGPGVANAQAALEMIQQQLPYANTFADIATPMTMSLASSQSIQLRGTASGVGFSHYEIQMAPVTESTDITQFTVGNFTTVATGNSPIDNDVLAEIDSSNLTSGSLYLVKLQTYDVNGAANESAVRVQIDGTLDTHWPIYFSDLYNNLGGIYSPVLADIDQDGALDVVTVSNRGLEAVSATGESLAGFPVALGVNVTAEPTVADLDKDGLPEIILVNEVLDNTTGHIQVFNNQGQLKAGFPAVPADNISTLNGSHAPHAPVIADLDGDGKLDIITSQVSYDANFVGQPTLRLVAVNAQGQLLAGYPKLLSHVPDGQKSHLSVHDLNNDGKEDIVTAYYRDGGGVDMAIFASNLSAPVILNTNFNLILDMVLFQATENGPFKLAVLAGNYPNHQLQVYQLNADYSLTEQWSQSLPAQPYHLIAHDMNGDHQLELIASVSRTSTQLNDIWAYDIQGNLMPNYPLQVLAAGGTGPTQGLTVAKVADYPNGVLLVSGYNAALEAIDMQGNKLPGWPKLIPYFQNGGDATVGDVDDDGKVEVIVNNYSGSAYAWELGEAVLGDQPWGSRDADSRHTNFIAPVVYTANFASMNMRGTFNGWANAPMTLVADNTWQIRLDVTQAGQIFKFDALGNWSFNWGDNNNDKIADVGGNDIALGAAGTYIITFNDATRAYSIVKKGQKIELPTWQRTVIFIYGQTQSGQDMFIRGGIDHNYANTQLGRNCQTSNFECAIPIVHNNLLNTTTAPWKAGDQYLDWYGIEAQQGSGAQGTALDWTTNLWPSSWGTKRTVSVDGYGETPLNQWGQHYWMLDVDMDCSKTVNGWFEIKSYISNGPGWEANVSQSGTPWTSGNHFAQCGKLNVFKRGVSQPVTIQDL